MTIKKDYLVRDSLFCLINKNNTDCKQKTEIHKVYNIIVQSGIAECSSTDCYLKIRYI